MSPIFLPVSLCIILNLVVFEREAFKIIQATCLKFKNYFYFTVLISNRLKDIAIEKLTSILQRQADEEHEAKMLGIALGQRSTMERGDRIRNYNFREDRVTCYKLNKKFTIRELFGNGGAKLLQELSEEYMDSEEDRKLEILLQRFHREINQDQNGLILLESLQQRSL